MNIKYLLLISLIFLFSPAITKAATEFISVVDTDGSSGDYSTLSSWEQFNQTNLTLATTLVFSHGGITGSITDINSVTGATSGATADVVHATSTQILLENISGTFQSGEQVYVTQDVNCVTISDAGDSAISVASCQATTSVADQTDVEIEGWTTSDTNYIKVYTTEANRHSGVWNTGKYRLVRASGGANLQIDENYVRIEGLQIHNTANGNYRVLWLTPDGETTDIRIDKCMLRTNQTYGVFFYCNGTMVTIRNCIIYGDASDKSGIYIDGYYNSGVTYEIYNCTIYGFSDTGGKGICDDDGYSTSVIKNCAVFGNSDDFDGGNTIDYCASDDGDGDHAVDWANESTDWANVFTDYANGDFHLNDFTGTGAIIDKGTDLTAEGFSDDIDSHTRPTGASWDIGADEAAEKIYRSVGSSASSALETGSGNDLTISGSTATFTIDLGTDVGVGDAIQYDTAGAGADPIDAICFIHGRTDETHFTVKNSLGGAPTATVADQDWSIFRSYDSLSHAESGDENDAIDDAVETFENWVDGKDIVTSNEQWNIACYNGEGDAADQTAVTINGWTTGVNNYIKVWTPTELTEVGETQRHSGVWDAGKYRLAVTSNDHAIGLYQSVNIKLTGLQMSMNPSQTRHGINASSNSYTFDIEVDSCIIKTETAIGGCHGINAGRISGASALTVINSIIYGFTGKGIGTWQTAGWTGNYFNNTIYDTGLYGIRNENASSVITVKNCAVFNTANDFDGTMTVAYSASDDSQAGTGNIQWTGGATDWANVFTDYANGDFHLNSFAGTGAIIDQGDDLSAEGFSDDIDSETRTNHSWDIGADEAAEKIYRSVGPSASSALETGAGNNLTISGSTATFASDPGTDVGVGDAIQYDTAGAAADPIDVICFIHGRTDETHYTVKNSLGGAPTATVADQDWSIFRSYDSLSHAESGDENDAIDNTVETFENWTAGKDIVTSNEQWNIACYNGEGDAADQTAVTINGWTTGVNNYIKIYTPTETTEVGTTQRHDGVWDDAKYRLSAGAARAVQIAGSVNIKFEGLQISINSSSYDYCILASTAGISFDIGVDKCIFKNLVASPASDRGISVDNNDGSSTLTVTNSVFYHFGGAGICFGSNAQWTGYIYNNVVKDCQYYGIWNANALSNIIVKNCAVFDTPNDFHGTMTIDYCASDDGDGTNVVDWANGATDWANVFVDYANGDFHLKDFTGTGAIIDQGDDLTTEGGFSDDIDGDSRPSPYWDIGADEYPAKQKAKFKGEFRFKGEIRIK